MVNTYGTSLATLDEEGERPSSRIGNAHNARTLVGRLKYEDEQRMWRYSKIMGLLDGNPPWSSKLLEDLGQGHRANFNLREGEGMVDSAKTPYWNLVFTAAQFANVFFDLDGVPAHIVSPWDTIFSEEFTDIMRSWIGFDQNMQLSQWQMCVHGVGPMFWPHGYSWQSEATKARKVLVPQETMANVEKLEICAVLHSWRADELEGFIYKAKHDDQDHDGWNVPLVIKAIIDSATKDTRQTYGTENYDLYQRAIRTGDIFYGIHRSDRIYVTSIFVKDFGGKVSHYIITDSPLGHEKETYDKPEEEAGYLYKKKGKFNAFSEVICPFFYDTVPDGTWHAVKGLGPKVFDFCDVSNRTFCQMLDGSVMGSGLILEAQDGSSMEETQVALVGGATVVQPGYKVVQTRIAESLNGAMSMRRELQNVLQSNTGSYRQRPSEENHEPTLGQAQLNYQQQSQLSGSAISRYSASLNLFFTETVRRLLDPMQRKGIPGGEAAMLFKKRCIARGIPEEILVFKNIRKVIAVPAIGYGSPQMMDISSNKLGALIPMMDSVGKNHALRTIAMSIPGIGATQVDSFFPPIEKKGIPNSQVSLAALENNALRQPKGQAVVDPQQDHSIHFDTHMADAVNHLKDPQAHPVEQLIHLSNAVPHIGEHLKGMEGDPTIEKQFKQKKKLLNDLSQQKDKLQQNVQEQVKAQQKNGQDQPQQQPSPEAEKVHGDLQLKAAKVKGELAIKAHKEMANTRLADKKAAAEIHRNARRTQAL